MFKIIGRLLVVLTFGWVGNVSAWPITGADIVTVDGVKWAQVDLFTDLSWNDINAVCPGGVCGVGTLNGVDMDGWLWASVDDVNALFNLYLTAAGATGPDLLGPGPDRFEENASTWAPSFFFQGWRPTHQDYRQDYFAGHTSTLCPGCENGAVPNNHFALMRDWTLDSQGDQAVTNAQYRVYNEDESIGGWFYHESSSRVPVPATVGLVSFALAGLGWTRRKKA